MTRRAIRISADNLTSQGQLNDSATARKIWDTLPFESEARRWGAEVYFPIPVVAPEEDAQATVESGTLAYWPVGNCFCIFFGQVPASPVNVVGLLSGDAAVWDEIAEGTTVCVERLD